MKILRSLHHFGSSFSNKLCYSDLGLHVPGFDEIQTVSRLDPAIFIKPSLNDFELLQILNKTLIEVKNTIKKSQKEKYFCIQILK